MQCAFAILSSVVYPALGSFSTLSHKRNDFRGKVIEYKICVFIFSITFIWNVSHSKRNWARYDQKCISVFMQNNRYPFPIVMKHEFYCQLLKILKYQISSLHRAFRKITSNINQQMHLYNFHLKHFKTLKTTPTCLDLFRSSSGSFVFPCDVITLARNDETSWWWSEKIETCRSGFKLFKLV